MAIIGLGGVEKKYLSNPSDLVEKAGFLIAQVAITVSYRYAKMNHLAWINPHQDLAYAE